MDHRCLVLTGRLLDGQDAATAHARLAAAFGMELAGFRERVFERAPLIIRRRLEPDAADAQAAQLRGMGVEADVLPESERLVWLRRDGQVRGPLPEEALARYAASGDQWCHDGGQAWFDWQADAARPPLPEAEPFDAAPSVGDEPPPLPEAMEPPPLPPSPPARPSTAATTRPPLSTAAVVAALFGLLALPYRPLSPVALLLALAALAYLYRRPQLRGRPLAVAALVLGAAALLLWMHRPPPAAVAQPYVPRPLRPLAPELTAAGQAPAPCVTTTAGPKNDEDRFLAAGERVLTGRAERKGDTYVAEAAVSLDGHCQPNALQLYVFRHGVFIGTVLDKASSLGARLDDFSLVDDRHLRVTLASCTQQPGECAATTVRQFVVMPGGDGWMLGEIK